MDRLLCIVACGIPQRENKTDSPLFLSLRPSKRKQNYSKPCSNYRRGARFSPPFFSFPTPPLGLHRIAFHRHRNAWQQQQQQQQKAPVTGTTFLGMGRICGRWSRGGTDFGTQNNAATPAAVRETSIPHRCRCCFCFSGAPVLDEDVHPVVLSLCCLHQTLLARLELSRAVVDVRGHAGGDPLDSLGLVLFLRFAFRFPCVECLDAR